MDEVLDYGEDDFYIPIEGKDTELSGLDTLLNDINSNSEISDSSLAPLELVRTKSEPTKKNQKALSFSGGAAILPNNSPSTQQPAFASPHRSTGAKSNSTKKSSSSPGDGTKYNVHKTTNMTNFYYKRSGNSDDGLADRIFFD